MPGCAGLRREAGQFHLGRAALKRGDGPIYMSLDLAGRGPLMNFTGPTGAYSASCPFCCFAFEHPPPKALQLALSL